MLPQSIARSLPHLKNSPGVVRRSDSLSVLQGLARRLFLANRKVLSDLLSLRMTDAVFREALGGTVRING